MTTARRPPNLPPRPDLSTLALAAVLGLTLSLAANSASAQVILGPLTLETEAQGIEVLGTTEGETVLLFGVTREDVEGLRRITHWQRLETDGDENGEIHFDLGQAIPAASSWIAVELGTGRSGIVGGDPSLTLVPVNELSATLSSFPTTSIPLARFDSASLIVRPQVGAWTLGAGDGSGNDADGVQNGAIQVAIALAAPLLGGVPPSELAVNDVVAVIDPLTLAASVVQLACDPVAGCSESF